MAGAWVEIARNFLPSFADFPLLLVVEVPPSNGSGGGWPGVIEVSMRHCATRPSMGALSPELATVVVGLTLYTTGFIAEIVRAGVLAIDEG